MLASCALTEVSLSLGPHATPDTTGEAGTEKARWEGIHRQGMKGERTAGKEGRGSLLRREAKEGA